MDRADALRALHVVNRVELLSHVAQFLGANLRDQRGKLGAKRALLHRLRGRNPMLEVDHASVAARAPIDLAAEHDPRRRSASDDRCKRALEGGDLERRVQASRENDESAAVVARDDAQDEWSLKVGDRPANLSPVLQFKMAQRLR